MQVYRNERPIRLVAGRIVPDSLVAQAGDKVVGFAERVDSGFFKGWLAWKTEYTPRGSIRPFGIAKRFGDEDDAREWLAKLIDERLDATTHK